MRHLAVSSDREVEPGLGLARHPFRLDETALAEPSSYVMDLLINEVPHTYGFSIDDEQVLEEWLYYYPLGKRRKVFEREQGEFKWGEESGKREELERIANITASTALFLSTMARFNQKRSAAGRSSGDPLHDVYKWFFGVRSHLRPNVRRLPVH